MNKCSMILPLLMFLGFAVGQAAAQTPDYIAVNTSSQSNGFPACGPVEWFADLVDCNESSFTWTGMGPESGVPLLQNCKGMTDGRRVFLVDRVDGQVYVHCEIDPMSGLELSRTVEVPELNVDWGNEGGVNLITWPGGGRFRLDNTGIGMNDRYIGLNSMIAWWRHDYFGMGMVRFRMEDILFTAFANGNATLTCEGTHGIRLPDVPLVRKADEFGIARQAREGDEFASALDTAWLSDTVVFVPGKGSRWVYFEGELRPVQAGATAFLVLCESMEDWTRAAACASYPLLGRRNGDGWEFQREGRYAVTSDCSEGLVFRDCEWTWKEDGKETARWDFRNGSEFAVYDLSRSGDEPAAAFRDFAGDGVYFQGDLLRGGRLFCGSTEGADATDLDGDGDADVYELADHYLFDMMDDIPGYVNVLCDGPDDYAVSLPGEEADEIVAGRTWLFRRQKDIDPDAGPLRDRVLYHLDETDGGDFKDSEYLMLAGDLQGIEQMAMGGFGADFSSVTDWNVSLRPLQSEGVDPIAERRCRYADPYGNAVAFASHVFPQDWNGEALAFEEQGYMGLDYSSDAPWFVASVLNARHYDGIEAFFVSEGREFESSTGIDGRNCGSARREARIGYSRPAVLYSSGLSGGLHLKGAAAGFAPEESVLYCDTDGDGYVDTYLYDAMRDGVADAVLWYGADEGILSFYQDGKTAVWSYGNEVQEVDWLIGDYAEVEEMYLRGAKMPPMVVRAELADSGIPVEWKIVSDLGKPMPAVSGPVVPYAVMREMRPGFYVIGKGEADYDVEELKRLYEAIGGEGPISISTYRRIKEVVGSIAGRLSGFEVSDLEVRDDSKRFVIESRGLTVKLPRTHDSETYLIDGEPVGVKQEGLFDFLAVPSGRCEVKILY